MLAAAGLSFVLGAQAHAAQTSVLFCRNVAKKDVEVIPPVLAVVLTDGWNAAIANPVSPDVYDNVRPVDVIENNSKRLRLSWKQNIAVKKRGFAGEGTVQFKLTVEKQNGKFRMSATGPMLFIPGNGWGSCIAVKARQK
ncbi:hypothetical protein [Rhodalgimonas zhirmunskyi]|uniref:Uncharacterized protein n=1 Tax=Rhodalgimonas zhirmunskyi TaxID=2964767 RepID=A0AAJ1U7W3_9RHOB|nr:hypothetical protein [Rhodoalgimonas zhirmunskyi]MDQ2093315.1 hypothetical protein [Rhodoalgimonas zhirmunskyi]